ncbi:MAG TPA: AAA family ATPase [Firmicutes bacterium]|nr:AAA family ATPase [Bacillota bacterium]
MKYVTGLILENFQSHARTELTFAPGLNVIVGPSDQGKTAVIRALRWVLYNEPRGTDFIRVGADRCRVTVTFSDGVEITREKGPGVNQYVLRCQGEERVFGAVGASVPPEVMSAHGMPPLRLDVDHPALLNVGGQLEAPFLMSEPGSTRAKAIGQVTGVHVLDAAVRDVVADGARAAREESRLGEEIKAWEAQLEQFRDIPRQEEALARAENLFSKAKEKQALHDRLLTLRQAWDKVERDTQLARRVLDGLKGLPRAETLWNECRAVAERLTRLEKAWVRWRDIEKNLSSWRGTLTRLEHLPQAQQAWVAADAAKKRWEKLHELHLRWLRVTREIGQSREAADAAAREQERLIHRYAEVLSGLGRCPTCGSPVGAEQLDVIIRDMFGQTTKAGAEA